LKKIALTKETLIKENCTYYLQSTGCPTISLCNSSDFNLLYYTWFNSSLRIAFYLLARVLMKLPNFHLIQIRNLSGEIQDNIVDVIMGFKSRVLRVPVDQDQDQQQNLPVLCGYFDFLNNLGGQFRFFKFFIIKELPVAVFGREIRIREPLVSAFRKCRQTGRFHERTAVVEAVLFIISKQLRTTVT
jgi:hypothetical protein